MLVKRIIKGDHKETDLEELNLMKYCNDLVYFDLLKMEIFSWIQHLGLSQNKKYDLKTISGITNLFRDEKFGLYYRNLEYLFNLFDDSNYLCYHCKFFGVLENKNVPKK